MTEFNATLELAKRNPTDDDVDTLMDAFADFHPTIGTSPLGWVEVTITVQAESLRQAIATALALAGDVVSITAMTTAEFDRRPTEILNVPDMSSVSEVAERLGISRTAVQERIDRGTLPARKVGSGWVVLGQIA